VATVFNGGSVSSADLKSVSDHCAPEIEQFSDLLHLKRVPREPEPPEKAARTCEEPESRQTGRWEAPDAGVDDSPPYKRGLTHGRSRG
jgi:hypothetical protein